MRRLLPSDGRAGAGGQGDGHRDACSGDGGDFVARSAGYPTFVADRPARWLCARVSPRAVQDVRPGDRRSTALVPAGYAEPDFPGSGRFVRALPYDPEVRTQLRARRLPPLGASTPSVAVGVRSALRSFDPYGGARRWRSTSRSSARGSHRTHGSHHHSRFYLADQTPATPPDRATMGQAWSRARERRSSDRIGSSSLVSQIPGRLKIRGLIRPSISSSARSGHLLPADIDSRRKQAPRRP